MSRTDGIDELDERFPISKRPQCPLFYATLALWETYPSEAARAFARGEAAWAARENAREETTFIRPLPPEPPPLEPAPPFPVPYPPLAEDTLTHEFTLTGPLDLLPGMMP